MYIPPPYNINICLVINKRILKVLRTKLEFVLVFDNAIFICIKSFYNYITIFSQRSYTLFV